MIHPVVVLVNGDSAKVPLKDESVQLVCFSPPYWGLRNYEGIDSLVWGGGGRCEHVWGDETFKKSSQDTASGIQGTPRPGNEYNASRGQFCQLCGAWRGDLGLEPTLELYLNHMMLVMTECWRVLRGDGVCFVNLGDSYASSPKGNKTPSGLQSKNYGIGADVPMKRNISWRACGTKPKSLCLVPQKFAIRCQEAGWIIRSEIIWAKPNPMPESVKDRPTRSHEQVWMMTKQGRYFWDQDAVREPYSESTIRMAQYPDSWRKEQKRKDEPRSNYMKDAISNPSGRNIRDVWTIATEPTPEAHFATWPTKLVEKFILAATRHNDIVFDPFVGSGKTLQKAIEHGRMGVGMDLSFLYLDEIARKRVSLSP